MLRRLLNILLDNAIKYTPELGTIDVCLERVNARLELKVRDSGIGIPADALSRIFDRFYKVDESRNREDGSSGLGLAIAKWIVEAHYGSIQVSSVVNEGSTFTVTMDEHADAFSPEGVAQKPVTV